MRGEINSVEGKLNHDEFIKDLFNEACKALLSYGKERRKKMETKNMRARFTSMTRLLA